MTETKTAMTALTMSVLLLTGAVGFTVATAPVSAQSDSTEDGTVVDGLYFDEGESGQTESTFRAIYAATMGFVDKYSPFTERPAEGESEQYAENFQSEFNKNSGVLMNWTNKRVSGSESADVVRLKFSDEDGGTSYLFVVSSVSSSGNYTDARVLNSSEFRDTKREHDVTYRLSPYASRNAEMELETFVEDYAEPDNELDSEYVSHLAGEYKGEIDGEGIPGDN